MVKGIQSLPLSFPAMSRVCILLGTYMGEMVSRWMTNLIEPSVEVSSLSILWISCIYSLWCGVGTEQADSGMTFVDDVNMCRAQKVGHFDRLVMDAW